MPASLLQYAVIHSEQPGSLIYLENKGTLETAIRRLRLTRALALTKLYDRTDDRLTLDEIEKISV